jgi:hypothetical protein
MYRCVSRIVLGVYALVALLAGCAGSNERPAAARTASEIPLLVRFDASHCPQAVIPVDAACSDPGNTNGSPCRSRNGKVSWLAVTKSVPPLDLPPFEPSTEEYTIEFGPDPTPLPNPPHSPNPLKDTACKQSRAGSVSCKIKGTAEVQKSYYYKVVGAGCTLDPRIYVPF